MSFFDPRRARKWLLYSAVAIVLIVAAAYWRGKARSRSTANRAAPMGSEVQRSTQGFSFSKSEGGHTLFTIHAAKAIEYKRGGRAHLEGVSITVYGRESNRFDQIYGDDFEYDPASGDVIARGEVQIDLEANAQGASSPDQAPPKEQKNLIHVKTSNLTFNQKSGRAITKEEVQFSLPQGQGTARGAELDSKTATLTLQSAVAVHMSGPHPADITAQHAVMTKTPRQAALEGVHMKAPEREFDAAHMVVLLRDDNQVDRMLASGAVRGRGTSASGESYEVRAPLADFLMGEKNHLRTALLHGGVTFDSAPGLSNHGSAENAEIAFGDDQRAKRVHATGNVHVAQVPGKGDPKKAQSFELIADALDLMTAPDGHLDRGETAGAARIEIQQSGTAGPQPPPKTVVTAAKFNATFDAHNRIRSLHGEPDAKIVSPNSTAGQPDRVSNSRSLDVIFSPEGGEGVQSIVQQGNVHFVDGQREAFADQGRYTPKDEVLWLTGSPRVMDETMTTTAARMHVNRATGDALAEGEVKSTYRSSKAQPGGAMLASGDPVHATAEKMTASRSTGVVHYAGNARLWQNADILQAPVIDFQRERRTMVAHGDEKHRVNAAFVQTNAAGKTTPVSVTSSKLTYNDISRQARFEGAVVMKSADGTMTAERLGIFLQPRNSPSSPGPSRIDHAVAEGGVLLQQPNRKATGDKLVYTAADEKFVLTGDHSAAPEVVDAQRGSTRGDVLTFYRDDDRVLVEGAGTSRAVTKTPVK